MRLHLHGIVTGCDGKIELLLCMVFCSHADFTFAYSKSGPVLQDLVWVLESIDGFAKPVETSAICLCSGSLWPCGDRRNSSQGWKAQDLCYVMWGAQEEEGPSRSSGVGEDRSFLGAASRDTGEALQGVGVVLELPLTHCRISRVEKGCLWHAGA